MIGLLLNTKIGLMYRTLHNVISVYISSGIVYLTIVYYPVYRMNKHDKLVRLERAKSIESNETIISMHSILNSADTYYLFMGHLVKVTFTKMISNVYIHTITQ